MAVPGWVMRVMQPLRSRKVRVAMVTIMAVYAAELGLEVNETTLLAIVTAGVSVILGIAIEDAGEKSRPQ